MTGTTTFSLKKIFKLKELPILLTFLFTLLGWTFMKVSDKITESPTIEYKFRDSVSNDTIRTFYYRLINLTNNKQFTNLNFRISTEPGRGHFVNGKLIAIPPAAMFNVPVTVAGLDKSELTFTIKRFNPKSQYNLLVDYQGEITPPVLQLSYNNIDDDVNADPLVLKKASVFTFLIKNDVSLYLFLFLILLTLSILYLINLSKRSP
jgi:hypothetical protein